MHETNTPGYWTPEKKAEWRVRNQADKMCRAGRFTEAAAFCVENKVSWPPYKTTPVDETGRSLKAAKIDRRKNNGGARVGAGAPFGDANPAKQKLTVLAGAEQTENLVEIMKDTLLTKGTAGIKTNPALGALTISDRLAIQRLTGSTAEEINIRLAEKLGCMVEELVDSLRDDIANGRLKPGEKAFPIAVGVDKRAILDGRNQLATAAVNIQVNNFNGRLTKAEIMARLNPGSAPAPVEPPAIQI